MGDPVGEEAGAVDPSTVAGDVEDKDVGDHVGEEAVAVDPSTAYNDDG